MECRILFHDIELQKFSWCKFEDSSKEVIDCGESSSADELTRICSESSKNLVFFPQQYILLASPQLPPRASKQQLNAIAYSVEDLLAEDIEDSFFAVLAQQADNSVPVAVIKRDIMDSWIQFLTSHHVNARIVLPSVYLCPWFNDDEDLLATICPLGDGFLIRTGLHEGLFCKQEVVNQVVALLQNSKSAKQNKVVLFGDVALNDVDSTKLVLDQQVSINLLSQPVQAQSCINLKQKDYQSSHQWLGLLRNWRVPIVALVLLGLVFVAGNLIDVWQKERLYDGIIDQQQTVLSQYLPDIKVTSQPKRQLVKVLADNRGNSGQLGFVDLLHEYSNLKKGFSAVITNKVLYQKSSLIINLETKDLNSLESFRNKLEKSNFQAQIENINISPEKTTGRLVMRASQ